MIIIQDKKLTVHRSRCTWCDSPNILHEVTSLFCRKCFTEQALEAVRSGLSMLERLEKHDQTHQEAAHDNP